MCVLNECECQAVILVLRHISSILLEVLFYDTFFFERSVTQAATRKIEESNRVYGIRRNNYLGG